MTTAESTPTERVDAPVMGFKNPTNWAIAAVAGPGAAAGLVLGMPFIPDWAVYTLVVLVSVWLVLQAVDGWIHRPSRKKQQRAEEPRKTAGVA